MKLQSFRRQSEPNLCRIFSDRKQRSFAEVFFFSLKKTKGKKVGENRRKKLSNTSKSKSKSFFLGQRQNGAEDDEMMRWKKMTKLMRMKERTTTATICCHTQKKKKANDLVKTVQPNTDGKSMKNEKDRP